ncbi:MAG: hypothetical protein AAGI51_00395 [Pseudomonadota bacterium]
MDSGRRKDRDAGGDEDAQFIADAGALDAVLSVDGTERGDRAPSKRRRRALRRALKPAPGGAAGKAEAGGARRGPSETRAVAVAESRPVPAPRSASGGDLVEAAPRPSLVLEMSDPQLERSVRRRAFFARLRLWLGFLLMVAAPSGLAAWYLHDRAADQYASRVAFAVRSLDGASSAPLTDLLLGAGADSTAGDSQMLFQYLQSQPLVEAVDARLDLREIYNRPEGDWLFSLGEAQPIEDLVSYWNLAVGVAYDPAGGIIHVEAKAFRPEDAQAVAQAVLEESETLINGLSTGARQDAVRFAEIDLAEAEMRVRDARLALQDFRTVQGTADVSGDIGQEMMLISTLRAQRSEAQSEYDSKAAGSLTADSPVLAALQRRIDSLDSQIAEAEGRIADGGGAPADGSGRAAADDDPDLVDAAGEQERLQVELEFATNMYTAAQGALEGARAEARRAQRYLATHIAPTVSDEAEYPERLTWSLTILSLLLVTWSILLLIISSIRDRS